MELRQYWNILRRRWGLALIPAVIVLVVGLATYRPAPTAYNVGMRFLVGQIPTDAADLEDEERLANWQTSEYVVNGITDWVRGTRFADAVSAELAAQGVDIPAGAIAGGLAVDNTRSMLQLSLTAGDAETLAVMMDAVVAVLQAQSAAAIPQLGGETAVVIPLDDAFINPIAPGLTSQLDLPLRVALALGAGIGLALLVGYLDPAVQNRKDIEAIGLPILGEIPKK